MVMKTIGTFGKTNPWLVMLFVTVVVHWDNLQGGGSADKKVFPRMLQYIETCDIRGSADESRSSDRLLLLLLEIWRRTWN